MSVETILSLGEDDLHLLDKNLHQDALFYTCYEKVIQYLIEESPNDIDRIKILLATIRRLKEDHILSFCTGDWYQYTLLQGDFDFIVEEMPNATMPVKYVSV